MQLDSTAPIPAEMKGLGMEYFLEVVVAKEVCEAFGDRRPTDSEIARLLMFYAENDAFPDWLYER